MNQINLVAIIVVSGMIGLVVGLIIWRNRRGFNPDKKQADRDDKAHQVQKPQDRPDVRS